VCAGRRRMKMEGGEPGSRKGEGTYAHGPGIDGI